MLFFSETTKSIALFHGKFTYNRLSKKFFSVNLLIIIFTHYIAEPNFAVKVCTEKTIASLLTPHLYSP